jgi:hypothetical protein
LCIPLAYDEARSLEAELGIDVLERRFTGLLLVRFEWAMGYQ